MLSEMNLAKRYLGARFGYGEPIPDGIYAIPCKTSKGNAFMKMEIKNDKPAGDKNFWLFWDEELTISWYNTENPKCSESPFSKAFRKLINAEV